MLVDSTSTNTAGVTGAIRQAAGTTGASFRYLLATAQIESGLNPNSKASTSSATGLFQFIDQTWLSTMKDAGTSLGYGKYAAAITRTKSGRLFVKDAAMRSEIMGLRKDPTANALMAGAFTKQNAASLRGKIGREPTDGELYIAHFLGAGGAAKLITAASQNPDAKATSLFTRAARSNNSIFYDKQGKARTTSQVYAVLVNKLDVARAKTDPSSQTAIAVPPVAPPVGTAPIVASAPSPLSRRGVTAPLSTPGATASGLLPGSPIAVRTISFLPPNASRGVAPAPAATPPAAATDAPSTTAPTPDAVVSAIAPPAPLTASDASTAPRAVSYTPDNTPVFYDLFRTDGRQAVSSVVSELWNAPPRVPANAATAVAPAGDTSDANGSSGQAPGAPLDLFNGGHPQRPRFDRSS
jgi:Transglycosylase SLT domain